MLEEILALAAAGGTAVVGAMATDAWESARSGVARLLGREDRGRAEIIEAQLDADDSLVRGAGEDVDQVRRELALVWGRRLAVLLKDNPEAADKLRVLVECVQTQVPSQQQAWIQHLTATEGGTAFGQQGSGGQHIHYHGTSDPAGAQRAEYGDTEPNGLDLQ